MPSRLLSLSSKQLASKGQQQQQQQQQQPETQPRNGSNLHARRSVSSKFVSLAARRRARLRASAGGRSSSSRLSSTAEKLLDDGDDSDGESFKSAATPALAARDDHHPNRRSSKGRANGASRAGGGDRGNNSHAADRAAGHVATAATATEKRGARVNYATEPVGVATMKNSSENDPHAFESSFPGDESPLVAERKTIRAPPTQQGGTSQEKRQQRVARERRQQYVVKFRATSNRSLNNGSTGVTDKAWKRSGGRELTNGKHAKNDIASQPSNITSLKTSAADDDSHAFDATFPGDEASSAVAIKTASAKVPAAAADSHAFDATFPGDETSSAVAITATAKCLRTDDTLDPRAPQRSEADEVEERRRSGGSSERDRPGDEALLFVYGPDADLRRDVFNVEQSTSDSNSDSDFAQIDRSYREQMEQLETALNCHPNYQHGMAFACGMRGEHLAFLKPGDFCEIKRDAIRHSYRILKEEHEARDEFQRSYKEMWNEVGLNDFDESISYEGSAETEIQREYDGLWEGFELPETDAGDARIDRQVVADFWSEENTTAARGDDAEDYARADFVAEERCASDGVIYGVHGDYSYDCEEDEDDEDPGLASDDPEVAGRHREGRDEGPRHEERGMDDSNHSSQLDYSYRSEDDDELDERYDAYMQDETLDYAAVKTESMWEDPNRKGRRDPFPRLSPTDSYVAEEQDEGFDYATVETEAVQKNLNHPNQKGQSNPPQHSPTDPWEFDQLIRDSLSSGGYFHRSSTPTTQSTLRGQDSLAYTDDQTTDAFDPFDLSDDGTTSHTTSNFPVEVTADKARSAALKSRQAELPIEVTTGKRKGGKAKPAAASASRRSTFICALPRLDDEGEDEDENEVTMGDLLERDIAPVVTISDLETNVSIITQDEVDAIDAPRDSTSETSGRRSARRRFRSRRTTASSASDDGGSASGPADAAARFRSCHRMTSTSSSVESRRRYRSRRMMASMSDSVGSASGSGRVGGAEASSSPFVTSAEERGTEPKEMFRTGSLSHLREGRTEDSDEGNVLNFDKNYARHGDGEDGVSLDEYSGSEYTNEESTDEYPEDEYPEDEYPKDEYPKDEYNENGPPEHDYDEDGNSTVVSLVPMKGAEPEGPNMSLDEEGGRGVRATPSEADEREELEIETFLSIASTFHAMNRAERRRRDGNGVGDESDDDGEAAGDLIQLRSLSCSNSEAETLSLCSTRTVETISLDSAKSSEGGEERKSRRRGPREEEDEGDSSAGIDCFAKTSEGTETPRRRRGRGTRRRPGEGGDEGGDSSEAGIDCFPAESEASLAVRFDVEEGDDSTRDTTVAEGGEGRDAGDDRCSVVRCLDACIDGIGDSVDDAVYPVEKFCVAVGCDGRE